MPPSANWRAVLDDVGDARVTMIIGASDADAVALSVPQLAQGNESLAWRAILIASRRLGQSECTGRAERAMIPPLSTNRSRYRIDASPFLRCVSPRRPRGTYNCRRSKEYPCGSTDSRRAGMAFMGTPHPLSALGSCDARLSLESQRKPIVRSAHANAIGK